MRTMENELKKIIPPIVESEGLVCDSIEIGKTDGQHSITVNIKKEEGKIAVDDCSRVSRIIDPIIEDRNYFKGERYLLIVSSSGS